MSCLICLEDTNNIINNKCNCKIKCHTGCFEDFLKNSNFFCPICRIKRKDINSHFNSSDLIHIIFRLPGPIALPLWFVISVLFTIFIFPFLAIREFYGNTTAILIYTIVIYLCKSMTLLYPMLITHCCVITIHFLNIRII